MAKIQASPALTPQDRSQSRFLGLLKRDILKLDLAELDFGIYRILNYRRAQVLDYLDNALPSRISAWTNALVKHSGRELASTEAENCYYHLHTFFARYWDGGDFIPRARRGGSAAYAVPYNGQDTHFHWATKGSHYVKSGELFARYAYKDGAHEVRFTLERAEVEKDNAKGSAKHFFPAHVKAVDGGFELAWAWRAATDTENKRYKNKSASRAKDVDEDDLLLEAEGNDSPTPATEGASLQERVLNAWLAGDDFASAKRPKGLNPELLASNARRFVRKNTSDFFVHPQLGEFLRGELDVYLKHEFVQVWDAADSELPRIRAKFNLVRQIALDLITFLAQIESFQATLFEKRKFVLQADYLVQCSWLIREGGDEGKKMVLEAAGNALQAEEWGNWVGQKSAAKGKKTDGRKLLTSFPHLPLHTRHFSADFKARVLACFDDIEAALGGELIHADNYAALRTIEPAYRERVKCIYIDPPYNTGGDGFLYKDEFRRHSTWASLMEERLKESQNFLSSKGVLFCSVDKHERSLLETLLDLQYGEENRVGEIIWHNVTDNNPTNIANEHEYLLCAAKNSSKLDPAWKNLISDAKHALINIGDTLNAEHKDLEKLKAAYLEWFKENKAFLGALDRYKYIDEGGVYTGSQSVHNPGKEGYRYDVLHDKTDKPCKQPLMGYRFPEETMKRLLDEKRIIFGEDHSKIIELKVYAYEYEEKLASVITLDGRTGANELRAMYTTGLPFKNPKPTSLLQHVLPFVAQKPDLVLDFFAGSATTGHAVINLNREDGGARKFLLVEQGEYFDTVTLPRIAKVMTAPEWKDGAPKDSVQHDDAGHTEANEHWSRRTLPLVRLLRLERYEDSLNALDFEQNQPVAQSLHAQAAIDLGADKAQKRHLLRYWLMDESAGQPVQLSTKHLADPFAYQLTLHEHTGERLADVDVLETARLLLGLAPKRQRELTDAYGGRHQLMEAVLAVDLARGTAEPKPVLLWLRAVVDARTDKEAMAEREWLAAQVKALFNRKLTDYDSLFHNRGAMWLAGERGESIDTLLQDRMLERPR
jgi:adenine-specific DNA-methyltransferase